MNKAEFFDRRAAARTFGVPAYRARFLTMNRFVGLLKVFDILLLLAAGLLAHYIRFETVDLSGVRGMTLILAALVGWFVMGHAKLHDPAVFCSVIGQMRRAVTALVTIFFVMLVIGYATKSAESISRLWVGIWFICAVGLFFPTRLAVAGIYRKYRAAGWFVRRFAICSSVRNLERVERFLKRWNELGPPSHELVGIYLNDIEALGERIGQWQHLVRGSIDDLLVESKWASIDSILVILPPGGCNDMEPVIQKLRAVSMDVDLLAGEVDPVWANRPVGKVIGLPVLRIMSRPLNEGQILLKRTLDVVIASLALLLLSPLLLLIALAIKLGSPGPVIFRQFRHGFNNRPFEVFKFRTMYYTPEKDNIVVQARRKDPRVTPIGSLLRKTSLDELPQLFNVLWGDMSIVGPRPHACEHNDQFAQFIDTYLGRHRIKPGITGWAQVNGYRGETDTLEKMRKRVEYDLHYADNWSISLDLKIMILTIGCLIHPNAY